MQVSTETNLRDHILRSIPQQKPFRFIDEILEISEKSVKGKYSFKQDEFFYSGHFPGKPITPGVILTETMAQIGLVPLAIYLNLLQSQDEDGGKLPLFTEADVEFSAPVLPGDEVLVESELVYYRHGKIKCNVTLSLPDGTVAASGSLAGVEVKL